MEKGLGPHWVCSVCKEQLAPVGKGIMRKILAHRKTACGPLAGVLIKNAKGRKL